jgi:tetratricopeptide (TPR) repeat protein
VATSYNNIGGVYLKKGDLENALLQFQRALEIRTRVFGSEHPDVAQSYGNMGYLYCSLGKAEEANEMFTKAYSIFLKVLGPDQLHTQQVKSEVD